MNAILAWTLLALAVALAWGECMAGEGLPPGTPLVGPDGFGAMALSGTERDSEEVAVTGQAFTKALRVRTKQRPARPYNMQLTASTTAAAAKGDVILASFWARAAASSDETGEALTEFVFEKAGDPWTKSVTYSVRAGAKWRQYNIPFAAVESYAAGGAHVCFRVGYDPQAIELAGFRLVNYGRKVKVSDLPVTIPTYRGQEPDAPWRKAAAERIEKHRKADITVRVTDARGRAVRGAEVSVKMKRHLYAFGSAVNCRYLQEGGETPDKKRYRQEIVKLFNRVVTENALKWPRWESNPDHARKTVSWLRGEGLEVRGHCLFWPNWRHVPRSMRPAAAAGGDAAPAPDPAALRKRVLDHIAEEAGAMKGKLVEWDVINEPFSNHEITDILGEESLVEWFKAARKADPVVKLYINDYAIISGGGGDSPHRRHYEKTIRMLIDKGAPLDGIGMQCHFGNAVTAPAEILKTLDRFAKFGRPIEITEFDMKTGIEAFEAAYTRDFMTAVFSHPSTVGVIMWGFWDGRHWKGNAPLFRKDWNLKPSGKAWQDLVFKKWWTEAEGVTDRRGGYGTRGFLGRYEVTASRRGRKGRAEFDLAKPGAEVKVVLE